MSVASKKTKVYFKTALIAVVIGTIGAVLVKNRNHQATVWFFHKYEDINVLWLILMTAVGSIFSFWVLSTVFRVWKEWRAVSKEAAVEQRAKQLEQRAQSLEEREKRIDDKINKALSDSSEDK